MPEEWLDYNGHMTEYRYLQVMADATDVFLPRIGADPQYAAAGHSYYTVETHIRHLGQAHRGDRLIVDTRLLGHDAKRLHLFHEVRRDGDETGGHRRAHAAARRHGGRAVRARRARGARRAGADRRGAGEAAGSRRGGSAHRGTVERLTPAENAELLQSSANIRLLDESDQHGWHESKRDLVLCMERHRLLVAMDGDAPGSIPGPEGQLLVAFTDDDAAQAWAESRHPAEGIDHRFAPSARGGASLRAGRAVGGGLSGASGSTPPRS